jgi:hypothetical protein
MNHWMPAFAGMTAERTATAPAGCPAFAGHDGGEGGYCPPCPTVPSSACRGTSVKNSVGSERSRPFTV